MTQVEIYTQPGCPFCARAIALLEEKNISFKKIHAPHGTVEREESIKRSGGKRTVPQIFINGQAVGGCDELMALEHSGELEKMLK